MTSTVTISAHCGDAKEVHVVVTEAGSLVEEFNIANGEKAERYAYDDRVISVKEVVKVDRRAKEIEDAEFSLRQATLRYEDAASRGFHMNNRGALAADVAARQAELDALTAPAASPGEALNKVTAERDEAIHILQHMARAADGEHCGLKIADDFLATHPAPPSVSDYAASYPIPAGVVDADPLAAVFAEPVAATPGDAGYETKTYADGTVVTGIGPLPDQSPAQQTARDEITKFLDGLDPAPFVDLPTPGLSEH